MFKEVFVEILQSRKMKKSDVAKATGISSGLISEYASGVKKPTLQNIEKIADYLGVSVDYLLGRDKKAAPDDTIRSAIINKVMLLSDDQAAQLLAFLESMLPE